MRHAFRKSTTAYDIAHYFDADRKTMANMINGSTALKEALRTGYGPDRFRWSAGDGGGGNWRPKDAPVPPVLLIHEREAIVDSLRVARDPCPACGIRADVGCKHRRAA
jgi:hypothetical protein